MSQELATRQDVRVAPISKSFDEMMRVADTLLKSGFLPNSIKTPAQAVSIILMGREVGLPEMQALRSINVIQGKPTLSAELMLALFSARVNGESKVNKSDETECVITFKRPGREPHTQRFTIEQARKLGFATKDNYNKQPATMLQWRCVSAGLRFYAPDAIAGISYTPDELGAEVNPETGEVIDLSLAREEPLDDVPAVNLRADERSTVDRSAVLQEMVAELKLKEMVALGAQAREALASTPAPVEVVAQEVSNRKDYPFLREMAREKARVGATAYYRVLGGEYGVEHADEIHDRPTKIAVFKELQALPNEVTP